MNVKTFLLFCFVETDADSCRSLSDLVSVDHSKAQSAGGVLVQVAWHGADIIITPCNRSKVTGQHALLQNTCPSCTIGLLFQMGELTQELTQSISADGGNIVEIPGRAHTVASCARWPSMPTGWRAPFGTLPGVLDTLAVTMGTVWPLCLGQLHSVEVYPECFASYCDLPNEPSARPHAGMWAL